MSIQRKVILFGTCHPYQKGQTEFPHKNVEEAHLEAFKIRLRELVHKNSVRAIAEEMNQAGMKGFKRKETTVQEVAYEFGLLDQWCNPEPDELRELGFEPEVSYYVMVHCHFKNPPEDEDIVRERWRRMDFEARETIMVDRLVESIQWPVLFVCGSEHISGFSERFKNVWVKVDVAEECWNPGGF